MSCILVFRSAAVAVAAFSFRASSTSSVRTSSRTAASMPPFAVRALSTLLKAEKDEGTSYEVDLGDQDAEQRLGNQPLDSSDAVTTPAAQELGVSTESSSTTSVGAENKRHRFSDLLASVGLDDSQVQHVKHLPNARVISPSDIFCNRELKLGGIRAIGFDMDYTLAQYQQPAFDKLAFDGAMQKLVHSFGYPEELLDVSYDHTQWTRGLIIDTQRGNFLKIDRHKYVRVAYHGFDQISSTTRKHLYSRTFNKVMSFSEKCKLLLSRVE
jgi:hypothetical protein